MKKENYLLNEQEKEFYFISHGDGSYKIVSAISVNGGYVYFLIEANNTNDGKFKPVISPIANIIDICGSPDVQVAAIEKNNPATQIIYDKLSDCIDDYMKSGMGKHLE